MSDGSKNEEEIKKIQLRSELEDQLRPDVLLANISPKELSTLMQPATKFELQAILRMLTEYEMYEHCQAIWDLINELYD